MSVKKILVTGSEGYIGRIICPSLHVYGYDISRYDLNFYQDIRDKEKVERALEGHDAVIHLAAFPRPELGNIDYLGVNYHGSINVFEGAVKAGLKKMVFVSSGCVYGAWKGNIKPDQFPIKENNYKPKLNVDNQTFYGHLKLEVEDYLRKNAEKNDIRCISLRLELPGIRTSEKYTSNYFAQASIENVAQMFHLALSVDLESYFEEFNVVDDYIPTLFMKEQKSQHMDIQKAIAENWPSVPNLTKGNESLWSCEKAKKLLGYKPIQNGTYDH